VKILPNTSSYWGVTREPIDMALSLGISLVIAAFLVCVVLFFIVDRMERKADEAKKKEKDGDADGQQVEEETESFVAVGSMQKYGSSTGDSSNPDGSDGPRKRTREPRVRNKNDPKSSIFT